jgi:AhpC/TSA family
MKRTTWATLAISILFIAGCSSSNSKVSSNHKTADPAPKIYASLPMPKQAEGELVLKLVPSWVRLEVPKTDSDETQKIKLIHGTTQVGAEKVNFYLSAYGPYSTKTSEKDSFSNSSTPIMVDANGDGKFDSSECWFASQPVRLGDQMFDVKQIDPGGKWIEFARSSAKLAGLIVGKPCPDFRFYTTDGNRVSLSDYKGKALLLDVWSMT